MNPHPRGSEWRKWDLHVHAPGGKLSDNYGKDDGKPDVDQFCRLVHESDVDVLAITDYFSLDSYFAVRERYVEMYPDDDKLLLPNLEVRLPLQVNRDGQEVNLHLIFRETLSRIEAGKFLGRLKTAATVGPSRANVTCADLTTLQDYRSATVSLPAIDEAIKETFGEHATVPSFRQEHLIVVASAKGDGIRPGGNGIQRKLLLTDEIDKFSDAFFANGGSRDHFLNVERLETADLVGAKPVFDGSDAHSFEDLRDALGKQATVEGRQRSITWIKADPTYAGLLQTLIEPADRVAIQVVEPDRKEPYKVISKVRFAGTVDFPAEVVFNRNLNAIIGTRSSGKSALLAYIAHAVDPGETIRLQTEAENLRDEKEAGPAAGYTWADAAGVTCEVEWESGSTTAGRVIYIPQNSLYRLSERPEEITKKIAPALFRTYPSVKTAFDGATSKAAGTNSQIKSSIDDWFGFADRIDERTQQIKDLGDKGAITAERDRLQKEIDRIKAAARLTDDEVKTYEDIAGLLHTKQTRLDGIDRELEQLAEYVELADVGIAASARPLAVRATVTIHPSAAEVPEQVALLIDTIRSEAVATLARNVEDTLVEATTALIHERNSLRDQIDVTKIKHADLIARHEANEELSGVVSDHKKQVASLDEISRYEKSREKLILDQAAAATEIVNAIAAREAALTALVDAFNAEKRVLTDLTFGIATAVLPEVVAHATLGLSQRSVNDYIKIKGDLVSYEDAQADPTKFLHALRRGDVTLNKNYAPTAVAADVLTIAKEVRFSAELDSDRIGGFARSSMTPGKQALFALTLMLNESQEPWPLLIDQPEDDLDSRSIYDTIVPYLTERKRERQIIMVTHNANLVIGADSEQIIVANRHGEDRKNKDSRTFEYFTGSLEHSQSLNATSATTLGRFGIREHACEILDGGEEAFRKRREKYKLRQS